MINIKGNNSMNPPPIWSNIKELFLSRESVHQTPVEQQIPFRLTDEDLLQIIDEIYLKSNDLLAKGKFHKVIESFLFLCDYDILFRRVLASQMTNESFGGINFYLNEEIMNFIVIIQSYFNSFRINLLSDIVRYLNNEYNVVLDLLPLSFQRSSVKFNNANAINLFFMNRLKDWYCKIPFEDQDEISDRIYEESIGSFKEIRINATRHLQRLIDDQLRKL